jgi:molybdopterin molybdotransferase
MSASEKAAPHSTVAIDSRKKAMGSLRDAISCVSDYDPNALHVEDANRIIRALARPLPETERVPVRDALCRVLAEDMISPINVPQHDNAAMDGWAFRGADLNASGDTVPLPAAPIQATSRRESASAS